MKGLDDVHQYRCLPFRRGLFGPATLKPVCIVGGGFTGLWTAILAKQQAPHLDIVILESDLCGAGASGRDGGCLLTWSAKYFTLRRLFGEPRPCAWSGPPKTHARGQRDSGQAAP